MGKQSNIQLKGTVGNVIFYNWKGIACIRTKPDKVKQAPVAKDNAAVFGMAANRAAILRSLLKPVLPEPGNRKIIHSLDSAFRGWLKTEPLDSLLPINDILFFNGFSFNEKTELGQLLRLPIIVSRAGNGQLLLHIPAVNPVENIRAPVNTSEVLIQVMAASLQIDNPSKQDSVQSQLSIKYISGVMPTADISLPLFTAKGRLSVVAIALQYYEGDHEKVLVNKLPWKPAGIVGSFYN